MSRNDQELEATQARLRALQSQIASLRKEQRDPVAYDAAVTPLLFEMNNLYDEVWAYLAVPPGLLTGPGACETPPPCRPPQQLAPPHGPNAAGEQAAVREV